uniref:Adaptor protein ClpS core domain-containing protein n=1 Tax=Dunaliella tertiolecta TaxID=3047 RepID=A0A7S3RAI3_DUNTE|mmetsp:Transcript_13112/g.35702  ORF Transcript_13112/g.35702 Transcript_13112/m.35702 type:complete len:173 (+) Transcript_13112:66-584(+)
MLLQGSYGMRLGKRHAFGRQAPLQIPTHLHIRQAVIVNRGGGGGVLDRPTEEIKTVGWDNTKDIDTQSGAPKTDTGSGNGSEDRQKSSPRGGGGYRVLLLKSEKHTEKGVVKAILQTVPGVDEAHARNCYQTSKALGMAIICSVLKEHAEFYAQQLYKQGCKTAIEPDTAAN